MSWQLIPDKPCPCGASNQSLEVFDARGIYIGRFCTSCKEDSLRQFRSEVLTNSNYDHDEPIEED